MFECYIFHEQDHTKYRSFLFLCASVLQIRKKHFQKFVSPQENKKTLTL
jgi:hypothetical protein